MRSFIQLKICNDAGTNPPTTNCNYNINYDLNDNPNIATTNDVEILNQQIIDLINNYGVTN